MEQEEDDFDDEHDCEEEEESENEEEDGEEVGEEENRDGQNDNKDAEMEELEKKYMNLRHQEQDILKNLKRHKDEDLKGQAVKNPKALLDKALEFRFLLQKVFSNSNRLPQEPVRSLFCDSHEGVNAAYSDLVDSSKRTLDSLAELKEVNLDNLRSHSHLRVMVMVMVMVMRIGHGILSCCRGTHTVENSYFRKQIDRHMAEEDR